MLKGSPYTLNSEHKPVRAPVSKENEKPAKQEAEKTNLMSQTSSKQDFLEKFGSNKRGSMSSATSTSTQAFSQSVQIANSTARQSVASKASRKRANPESAQTAKVGVKRKSPLNICKSAFWGSYGLRCTALAVSFARFAGEIPSFNISFQILNKAGEPITRDIISPTRHKQPSLYSPLF